MDSNLKIVDDLGRLMAKKAALVVEEERLKAALRDMGTGTYEGALFRATVGEWREQTRYDAQAMRDKLWSEGYFDFVKKHTAYSDVAPSVRVVARTGRGVEAEKEAA